MNPTNLQSSNWAVPPVSGGPGERMAAALSEAKRVLRERRLRGDAAAGTKPPPIPRRAADARVPLSFAQQRMWFFNELEPNSPLYNLPLALRLRGALNPLALRAALNAIVQRHEVLRTRIIAEAGEPRQVVDPPAPVELAMEELTAAPGELEAALQERITTESERPFDLARERPLRARLIRLGPLDQVLLIVLHHIAGDGWSWGVFLHELAALYPVSGNGTAGALPEPSIQYGDFALWQRQRLAGPLREKLLAYWRGRLAGVPDALELPTDHPRPPVQTFGGSWETRPLGADLGQALQAFSQREGATLFMTLLAAYGVQLARYARQVDLVVAAPIAGRTLVQTEKLIGFFVNTLPLRLDLSGAPGFRELVGRVRTLSLEAFTHQEMPFEKLVEELHPTRRADRLPLAQVAFVLQNTPGQKVTLPGLEVTPVPSWTRTAKFDLTLCIEEIEEGLVAGLEYNRDLFEPDTARRMLANFHRLLEGAMADPNRSVMELPLLSPAEQQCVVHAWNQTGRPYPRDATVHRLFEAQVERNPAATALVWREQQLSYAALNARANQLAHRLRGLGVGPDQPVALCLDRSPELIITLLAILKAGGAYVSLDPTYPRERLASMLADAGATVLVTTGTRRELVAAVGGPDRAGVPCILSLDTEAAELAREPESNPPPAAGPENLAYLSYTSGTTGRPKGVCIPHRAVNRLLFNTDYINLGPDDVLLQISNCAFDASTFEVWGALLHGGRLVLVPPETLLVPHDLRREIEARGVTAGFFTTALFNQLARHAPDLLRPLRHVLFGGEAAHPETVRTVLRQQAPGRLLNVYGPTEVTTFSTWYDVRELPARAGNVPIGRPIANTTAYVLDERRQPVPIGVPGELHLGGDGVARGYWNQPELTAEKFIPDPFRAEPEARLYRTGDLVRWRPAGVIEFLGRIDRQVKLRGFRIELPEIEAALERCPGIIQAVVVARDTTGGERRLVAYVVAGSPVDPAELRAHLQQWLPEYMIPAAFVPLPALPLNANGKIDHAALPAPETRDASAPRSFAAPRDDEERRLVEIWERVLGVSPIGTDENFFELGGHSLVGVRMFAELEQAFGRKLPLAALFSGPTIAQLAQHLRDDVRDLAGRSLVALQPRGDRPPLFFVHGAGAGNLWMYANLVPHLGANQPVYAFEYRLPAHGEPCTRIEEMAARYLTELRTVQPHGPYLLSGYCFGGNIAYEMACQLQAAGEPVGLVALVDSAPPNGAYYRLRWWRPDFPFRFAANTAYWLYDFFSQEPAARRNLVRRKLHTGFQQFRRWFGRRPDPAQIDLDTIIDTSLFPAQELAIWQLHVRASANHRPRPFPGRVTLIRTRGHPFFCSFDPKNGWGELAAGGVEVITTPGAHERIFLEPHVRDLAARLQGCLDRVPAAPRPEPSVAAA